MASFFGMLKGQNEKNPAVGVTPVKRDPHAPVPTPLERMLANAGPIRNDGSDKFFGFENFGNSCYCNSIVQCLYYSKPFRENILAYPQTSTPESITHEQAHAPPRKIPQEQNGQAKKPPGPPTTRNAGTTPQQQKPEDKDSPEYKKKMAITAGPIVNITYTNNQHYEMTETLFTSLKDVFEAILYDRSRTGVVSAWKLLEVLKRDNEMFRNAMHQDAHEFLNFLLNTIVESIEDHNKKLRAQQRSLEPPPATVYDVASNNESGTVSFPAVLPVPTPNPTRWLHELFEGTLTSETRCLTCETTSQRDEPFLDLSVDLEQHTSITACLRRFSEEEMLCERNKFHCDNCGGLQEAEKRMKLKRLPKLLALHLKRFKYTEDFGRLQKLFHKVVYPYHLRLFNTTDDAEDPDRIYELYAVVVHIGGGAYHGHYVSVIKTQDRGWLLFDDEMVEPVDENFVFNFFGDKPGMACAYVLFYQETTIDAIQKEQRMKGKRRPSQDLTNGLAARPRDSSEMIRVHTTNPAWNPALEEPKFAKLDHAMTMPQFKSNGHIEAPWPPPVSAPRPPSPILQSKKEKAKEEKARKAAEKQAEKEREASEKERRKALAQRLQEAQKKQEAELKAALEASKMSKAEEDRTRENAQAASHTTSFATSSHANGSSPSGLDKFKRSRSLRFGSLTRKDKDKPVTSPPLPEDASAAPLADADADKDLKDKRNRFSIRKKSFPMLS